MARTRVILCSGLILVAGLTALSCSLPGSSGDDSDETDGGASGFNGLEDEQVFAPQFSPVSGSYKVQTEIAITTVTVGAQIYYTTDGSEPDESGLLYDETKKPILFEDTEFKAVAIRQAERSPVTTASYVVTPYFEDFDLVLKKGTTWSFHYRWVHTVLYDYSDESFTVDQDFSIVLGDPVEIDGIAFYAANAIPAVEGETGCLNHVHWSYLAYDNRRLLGSKDGATYTVLFDAMNGFWPGQGFFSSYEADKILSAAQSGDTYTMYEGSSWSENSSTYYPGTGTIYDPDPYSAYTSTSEVYKNGIGPYSWDNSSGSSTASSASGDHYSMTLNSFE